MKERSAGAKWFCRKLILRPVVLWVGGTAVTGDLQVGDSIGFHVGSDHTIMKKI